MRVRVRCVGFAAEQHGMMERKKEAGVEASAPKVSRSFKQRAGKSSSTATVSDSVLSNVLGKRGRDDATDESSVVGAKRAKAV